MDETEVPQEPPKLEMELTPRERDTLLREAGEELGIADELRAVAVRGGKLLVAFSEEDWEEIAGYLSVQANRATDPTRIQRLDALIELIEDFLLQPEEGDEDE
ncbi:MAG: hypothetical protein ACP5VF_05640 [Acidobacteriota bacterium]